MIRHLRILAVAVVFVCMIFTLQPTFAQPYWPVDCATFGNNPYQGIILESVIFDLTIPSGVGVGEADLKAGDVVEFIVTQVSGGPTPVEFFSPGGLKINQGVAPVTFTYPITEDGIYDFIVQIVWGSNGRVRVNWSCSSQAPTGQINDGRLNKTHLGTLAVVYPQETQIDVYAVNRETSEGWMVIRVPVEDLPDPEVILTEPLLLGEAISPFDGNPVALYLLPSGEFLLAATNPDGTPYRFLWRR
jgi:hypothetical protein